LLLLTGIHAITFGDTCAFFIAGGEIFEKVLIINQKVLAIPI